MLQRSRMLAIAGATAAACVMGTGLEANAASIIGLVDGKSIVKIDPETRKASEPVQISGADMLVGIDVRPADGMLYGVTSDGTIVTIDIDSGKATMKSKLTEQLASGGEAIVDFNPAADRLRLMSSDGTSLRVNVEDGKAIRDGEHKYSEKDPSKAEKPRVVAGAYTNSMKGEKAESTTLYNIDAATSTLVTQNPPNDGVLNTVGTLGVTVNTPVAFQIVAMSGGKNAAWLVAGGALHSVDLETGKAAMVGKIEGISGTLTDMAWVD